VPETRALRMIPWPQSFTPRWSMAVSITMGVTTRAGLGGMSTPLLPEGAPVSDHSDVIKIFQDCFQDQDQDQDLNFKTKTKTKTLHLKTKTKTFL